MKPMKMLLAAALVLLAGMANAADGVLGWNTTKKDWVKIRASASGFMFSGQDANDYITLYSATTATTGAKPQVALPLGAYRVRADIAGTGAVSATIEVYCNNSNANTGGTQFSTDITLNDTDADSDVLASDITTACPWGYIEVDAVSADTAMTVVAIPILAPTGAGSSSSSPAYSTIVTLNGQSAMDDTADAVVTKAYITNNSQETDALDVDSAACTTTCPANYSLTVGTYGWGYVQCTIKNVGDGGGGTPTIDAMKIWLQSKDEDLDADTPPVLGGSTGVDADDFVSPVYPIIWARSGTAGTVDATPDMPNLDEGDSYEFQIDVRGAYTMKIGLSASADNTSVNIDCNGW